MTTICKDTKIKMKLVPYKILLSFAFGIFLAGGFIMPKSAAATSFSCNGNSNTNTDPSTVLVVYDSLIAPEAGTNGVSASTYVAQHYAQMRCIPQNNLLDLGTYEPGHHLTLDEMYSGEVKPGSDYVYYSYPPGHGFINDFQGVVQQFMADKKLTNQIQYIVPVYGVPYKLFDYLPNDGTHTWRISLDSILAGMNSNITYNGYNGGFNNPYYIQSPTDMPPHFKDWINPAGWKMYIVTRLDGPSAVIAAGLVDKAVQAENENQQAFKASGYGYYDFYDGKKWPDSTFLNAYNLGVAAGIPTNGTTSGNVANWQSLTNPPVEFFAPASTYTYDSASSSIDLFARFKNTITSSFTFSPTNSGKFDLTINDFDNYVEKDAGNTWFRLSSADGQSYWELQYAFNQYTSTLSKFYNGTKVGSCTFQITAGFPINTHEISFTFGDSGGQVFQNGTTSECSFTDPHNYDFFVSQARMIFQDMNSHLTGLYLQDANSHYLWNDNFTSDTTGKYQWVTMPKQAPNALFAWGWYGGINDAYSAVPGAIGAQLNSWSSTTLRNVPTPDVDIDWTPYFLANGFTASWGATGEPYQVGYAYADNLFNHFWHGYNFGESSYLANPYLNWMMNFVGDPLYQPGAFADVSGPPTISSLNPSTAPGGNLITVTGTNFTSTVNAINIGSVQLQNIQSTNNGTSLNFFVPRQLGNGSYNVNIANGNGSSTPVTFIVGSNGSLPTLSSLSPNTGPAGITSVTVTGTNFTVSGNTIHFGGTDINNLNSTNGGTRLVFTVPGTAQQGPSYFVSLTNANGSHSTNSLPFTVTSNSILPTVSSLNPNSGAVGNNVIVAGTNFTPGNNTVEFGGTAINNIASTNGGTNLTFTVPQVGTGSYNVSVNNANGPGANSLPFNVTSNSNLPTVSSLTPNSGPVDTPNVTVAGTNFTVSGNTIHFGGTDINNIGSVNGGTSLTFTVPQVPLGPYGVTVTNGNGSGPSNPAVTFVVVSIVGNGPPTISSLSTYSGLVNTNVIVTGTNFTVGTPNQVLFGSTIINNISSANGNTLNFNVPQVASGNYNVNVKNGNGTSKENIIFNVASQTNSPPVISNIAVSNITQTGATITWTTDVNSDSQVDYGLTSNYGSSSSLDTTPRTNHTVSLSNLLPGTLYHYRVKSKDAAGNPSAPNDQTFTTAGVVASNSITSTVTGGNWSAPGTWQGGVVPGDGNFVVIQGPVVIDQNIGTNGNGIKNIILGTAGANLTVNSSASRTIYFASTGTNPEGSGTYSYPGTDGNMFGFFVLGGALNLTGTLAHPITIKSGNGSSPVYINKAYGPPFVPANITLKYVDIYNLGTGIAQSDCNPSCFSGINYDTNSTTASNFVDIENSRFTSPYQVLYTSQFAGNITFKNNFITGRTGSRTIYLLLASTGGESITDNTEVSPAANGLFFDDPYAPNNAVLARNALSGTVNYYLGGFHIDANGTGAGNIIQNNLVYNYPNAVSAITNAFGNNDDNTLAFAPAYLGGQIRTRVDANISEGACKAVNGGAVITNNFLTGSISACQGQIFLNNIAGTSVSNNILMYFPAAPTAADNLILEYQGSSGVTFDHNTFIGAATSTGISATGDAAIIIGDNLGSFPEDTNTIIKSNLMYNNSYGIFDKNPGTTYVSDFNGVGVHHNDVYQFGYNNGYHRIPASTHFYDGTHEHPNAVYGDISADPMFADATRNSILQYDSRVLGGPGTAADVFTRLGYRSGWGGVNTLGANPIDDMRKWLFAGFVPTNNALKGAAADGGDMGAVPVVSTQDTIPPTNPTNLSATAISSSAINLSWTASTDNVAVTGYKIFRGVPAVQIGTSLTNSYPDSGLSASTNYTYTVSAYDAAGNDSGKSNQASATTQAIQDTTPPVISNILTSNITQNSASITWTTNEISDSQVDYGSTSSYGFSSTLDTTLRTSHTVSLPNLLPGTLYHYRVKSKDAAGNPSVPNDQAFTTASVNTSVTISAILPSSGSIDTPVTITGTGFKTSGGSFVGSDNTIDFGSTPIAHIITNDSTHLNFIVPASVGPGNYSVSVTNTNGTGGGVNFVVPDTISPTAPTNLSATAISSSAINLSWTASTDNVAVTGYKIFRGSVQIGTSLTNSYPDSGLTASTNYTYTVSAYDAAGNDSIPSARVSAVTQNEGGSGGGGGNGGGGGGGGSGGGGGGGNGTDTTPPTTPSNVTGKSVSSTEIVLSWSPSSDNVGVTGYTLFRNGVDIGTTPSTSYSDTGLSAQTQYFYSVSAYDNANNPSSQSSPLIATTLSADSTTNTTTSNTTTSAGSGTYFSRVIKGGDTGADVKLLQIVLKNLGFFPKTTVPTTYFGSITQQALVNFQTAHQLNRTGLLDQSSQTTLDSLVLAQPSIAILSSSPSSSTSNSSATTVGTISSSTSLTRKLVLGSTGSDVVLLQQILIKDGDYPEALATGYLGVLTQKAVERFQIKYAIVPYYTPTYSLTTQQSLGYGSVGPKTRSKMNSLK